MKKATRFLLLCGLLTIAMLAPSATHFATAGGGNNNPLLPPDEDFRGRSLGEWSVLWTQWFVENALGSGSSIPDTVNKVRLLLEATAPGNYESDVTVKPGTGFVFPAMFIYGEIYADGSSDDPGFVFPDEPWAVDPNLGSLAGIGLLDYLYLTTHVEVKVNGTVVLSGQASDLEDYHFGPTYFDSPIVYEETLPNNAVAAAWCFGVGAVYSPLPKGSHTVELNTIFDNIFFGHAEFHYIYHINVTK